MKKIIAILLMFTLLLGVAGCTAPKNEKPLIICTLFAHYDWVRNILGEKADRFELKLLGNGADLHSYEASAMDLATLGRCDLLIYNGGSSEEWVEDAIAETKVKNALNISEQISLLSLPHEHTEEEHHHEYDEHTWLSLKSSAQALMAIGRSVSNLDKKNKDFYIDNTMDYARKILDLDQQYRETIDQAKQKILVLADRHPFRYLANDYQLVFFAAFDGCSAETEAGAATVANLVQTVDHQKLHSILILENSKEDLAKTLIESTQSKDQQILRLNSMQAIAPEQMEQTSYLSIMEENLDVLKTALN